MQYVLAGSLGILVAVGCGKVATPAGDGGAVGSGALALARTSRWLPQNGHATVDVAITRSATSMGELTVHVSGLPDGVTAADLAVPATASTGTLTFAASPAAALGSATSVQVELQQAGEKLDTRPFLVKVSGAPGTLDTTFGVDGLLVLRLPDPIVPATSGNGYARGLAQYPATAGSHAGEVVIAAQLDTSGAASTTRKLALLRFTPDGKIDAAFGGGNGYVLLDLSPSDLLGPVAVAIDSQGRIVVYAERVPSGTGGVCENFVARYTDTGAVDPTFTMYEERPPGGFCGSPMTLSIIDGDKLVLQGFWNNPDHSQRPVLVQLQSNGIPDAAAFASGYSLRLPNPDTTKPVVRASAFSADGHGGYLVAGQKCEGGFDVAYSACESIVGRVTATGTWDTTFGTAGAGGLGYSALVFGTTQDPALAQLFFASARDASGNLVAVGNNEGLTTGTVARFLGTTGAIDTAFGTSGRITPVLVSGATAQQFNDVVIDEDGQITAVGTANSGGPLVVVARYTATGAPDTSYGTAGVGTTTAAAHSPRALLQADGRLIVAGAMPRGASGVDVVAWRFWP